MIEKLKLLSKTAGVGEGALKTIKYNIDLQLNLHSE